MTFVKGKSGNPNGRPKKGTALTDLLEKALAEKGADGQPKRKALMLVLVNMGLSGDLDAIKVILDRVDGRVVERLEHSGPDAGPLRVENVFDLSRLTPGELAHLEGLVDKAAPDQTGVPD